MFRVEVLPDRGSARTPGYSYVAERRPNPQAAMAPALSRKRGIQNAGKSGDMSSRRAATIARHIADLDRENKTDVHIPVPVKQAKEAGARGTRTKTTSNVRRILQSQKTFKNHLDDEEAAIAAGAGVGLGSGNTGTVVLAKGNIVAKGSKAALAAAAAAKRSSTPGIAKGKGKKRASTAPETTDAETEADEDVERDQKLLKTEHDHDPLLQSYAPTAPSERIIGLLLAEPPLSYNAARTGRPQSSKPGRNFCCMCGYWGKIRCKSCHLRTCGLECYRVHEDSRCGAFF
ncbi:Zinc finger HIT-type [Penicillium taxi]|uniref:Zinc finger HIT-type n=1 Tax=Penicillium taxi TaxID=168475 RepID=UPI002545628F|nr:Zinc finger HIT-type [Penicillium taxi]KAJ5899457.1 Zinc finger HIT-type [Penicillium taxi]